MVKHSGSNMSSQRSSQDWPEHGFGSTDLPMPRLAPRSSKSKHLPERGASISGPKRRVSSPVMKNVEDTGSPSNRRMTPEVHGQHNSMELHWAAHKGEDKKIRRLLQSGVPVNARTRTGFTPLHYAVQAGHGTTVTLLIRNKADVNAQDRNKDTPLHLAAQRGGDGRIIGQLIFYGAKIDAQNQLGYTPWHFAKMSGRETQVRPYLEQIGFGMHSYHGWIPVSKNQPPDAKVIPTRKPTNYLGSSDGNESTASGLRLTGPLGLEVPPGRSTPGHDTTRMMLRTLSEVTYRRYWALHFPGLYPPVAKRTQSKPPSVQTMPSRTSNERQHLLPKKQNEQPNKKAAFCDRVAKCITTRCPKCTDCCLRECWDTVIPWATGIGTGMATFGAAKGQTNLGIAGGVCSMVFQGGDGLREALKRQAKKRTSKKNRSDIETVSSSTGI